MATNGESNGTLEHLRALSGKMMTDNLETHWDEGGAPNGESDAVFTKTTTRQ